MGVNVLNPFGWLSPSGSRARLSIFIFHRVLPAPDPLLPDDIDVARFERIVGFLRRGFNVLPLADAARRLAEGRLPAAAACITFDDGYLDNLTLAAPVLKKHGLSATFFIATGFSGGGRMWNDTVIEAVRAAPAGELDWQDVGAGRHPLTDDASRVAAYQDALKRLKYLPPDERLARTQVLAARHGLPAHSTLMMSPAQLRELRDLGMDIGGHTVSHPILSSTPEAQAYAEIAIGREQLTAWLGEAPTMFAYPNGVPGRDYGVRDVALVRRAGYAGAVSTAPGVATAASDPFQLPRFTPWDVRMARFGLRCAMNLMSAPAAQAPLEAAA
ncbi:MAG: polysaccharide deacetylase family protein [Aquincola tertiaricarbonis]